MEIKKEENQGVNVVSISGRLDASTAGELEEALAPFQEQENLKVLVDCAELEYISSAGLRVLLATAKEMKKTQSKISLCALNSNVKQVFEISGFTSIFPIHDTQEMAVQDLV